MKDSQILLFWEKTKQDIVINFFYDLKIIDISIFFDHLTDLLFIEINTFCSQTLLSFFLKENKMEKTTTRSGQ